MNAFIRSAIARWHAGKITGQQLAVLLAWASD
jgi:hypothetical protein